MKRESIITSKKGVGIFKAELENDYRNLINNMLSMANEVQAKRVYLFAIQVVSGDR